MRALLRCGALLGLAACAETALQANESLQYTGVSLVGARYQSHWTGASQSEAGWQITNDLGWIVTLSSGWITNYTASLVACADVVAQRPSLLPPAFAGHSSGEDPSAQISPYVESLMQDTLLDTVWFAEQGYCRFHWAMGAATPEARNIENAPTALGHSLYLQGIAVGPEGQAVEVQVESLDVQAVLVDLEVEGEESYVAEVTITHDLSRVFDGIDFSKSEDWGWQVLSALKEGSSVGVVLEVSEAVVDSGHLHE